MESKVKNLVIVLGPTGVGKSRTSILLAHALQGEIINCDSMQVYRGFDIGTDKVPLNQREGILHHLLDWVEPDTQFTAADFVHSTLEAAAGIWSRHHLPLITGGTGLYLKALIEGLFPEGKKDPDIRRKLEREAERDGLEALWQRLLRVDPVYAQKIGPRDSIRIIRALEVFALSGKPLSFLFAQTRSFVQDCNLIQVGLCMGRQDLYSRINLRVERMFSQGMVQEVQRLVSSGVQETAPPFRALGYQQVLRYLRQEISLEQAVELTQQKTRRYAKRQMTWFRKMEDIHWFSPEEQDNIKAHIQKHLK